MELPAFTPTTDWQPLPPDQWPSWATAKRVAVDLETCDPNLTRLGPGVRTDGRVVGVAFAIEDGPATYLPVGHYSGENLDEMAVYRYLHDQSKVFRGELVGANLQYDMDYLAQMGVEFYDAMWRDVQIAEPLLDELQLSYSLDNIAARHGIPGKDETLLRQWAACLGVSPKVGLWQLPPQAVGQYAEQDVRLPLQLLRRQERQIEKEGIWKIFDLECKLQRVLLKMRRRGVRVNFDRLNEVERIALAKEEEALAEITRQTGIHLTTDDTTKTSALVPVLHHLGIPIPRTEPTAGHPTGQDSLKNDYLTTLDHPLAGEIRTARKWNKLRRTFVASIRRHAVGDRIHCTFNQLRRERDDGRDEEGARYGRLSCTNPNLQQQPARDQEIGPLWRSIYVPDDGARWACLDYSQQEPRWLTHYAELLNLPRAVEVAERYRTDPTTDNHNMMATLVNPEWPSITDAKLKKKERDDAKQNFLGLCYGMGGGKLCRKLGLPTETRTHSKSGRTYEAAGPEGQRLLDKFDAGVPYVRLLARAAEGKVARTGFIRTAGGRKCRFPKRPRGGYDWAHKALNRLIQGSSGDQTKQAMVNADDAGVAIQLQVHDELDFSIYSLKEATDCAEIMRNALPCNIPAKVDIEIGPSWGEISGNYGD